MINLLIGFVCGVIVCIVVSMWSSRNNGQYPDI